MAEAIWTWIATPEAKALLASRHATFTRKIISDKHGLYRLVTAEPFAATRL
jgi:hypothetical protein